MNSFRNLHVLEKNGWFILIQQRLPSIHLGMGLWCKYHNFGWVLILRFMSHFTVIQSDLLRKTRAKPKRFRECIIGFPVLARFRYQLITPQRAGIVLW